MQTVLKLLTTAKSSSEAGKSQKRNYPGFVVAKVKTLHPATKTSKGSYEVSLRPKK